LYANFSIFPVANRFERRQKMFDIPLDEWASVWQSTLPRLFG